MSTRLAALWQYHVATDALVAFRASHPSGLTTDDSYLKVRQVAQDATVALADANRAAGIRPWYGSR